MVWHSIVQHFQHFDAYLTEGVYQRGCHLTGKQVVLDNNPQVSPKPLAEYADADGFSLIFGYVAAPRPLSRTAFH